MECYEVVHHVQLNMWKMLILLKEVVFFFYGGNGFTAVLYEAVQQITAKFFRKSSCNRDENYTNNSNAIGSSFLSYR